MNRWFVIRMILLLVLGLALNSISTLVGWAMPETVNIYVGNIYFDKNYKAPSVTVLYYIYELAPYVDNVIRAYVFYRLSSLVSYRLTKVAFWFAIYYGVQVLFYLWNRNTSGLSNLVVLIAIVLMLLQIVLPYKKMSKIRDFDD